MKLTSRLLLLALAVAVVVAVFVTSADAHLISRPKMDTREAVHASQMLNLRHAQYVCRHGANGHKRWSCKAVVWLRREAQETAPPPPRPAWGPHAFPDACLREISRRETAGTFSPTIWNYQGSGAYGIGQALPASKMAPFGADYMTNPWTQMRWMIAYVNGRHGGSCAALAFHNAHGWY